MAKRNPPDGSKTDVDAIKHAIRALESPTAKRERERTALFEVLYPDIRDKLIEGVAKSVIIRMLAAHKPISATQFDALLEAEAKRRGEPLPGKDEAAPSQMAPADEVTQMLDVQEGK